MSYNNTGFSFNPSFGYRFNPNSNGQSRPVQDTPLTDSPYLPACDNNLIEDTHRNQYQEYTNAFGNIISYQPVKYNFNTHNFLYGEDPTSGYHYARKLKAKISFTNYTTFLSKWGYMSDADITIYIPISEFNRVWGSPQAGIYPLEGDLFIIDNSACDRPLGQSPMVFEVTGKDDKIKPVDFMGRHYVWKLQAKRFDYSYEPNAPEERFLDDTSSDTGQFGRLAGGDNPPDLSSQRDDVDDFAAKEFKLSDEDQSVYGKYL